MLAVALGGACGSVARYVVATGVQRSPALARWGALGSGFPWGTLVVNITGCFLMGFLAGLFEIRYAEATDLRALVLVGVLGGYTTFSAFALDTLRLAQHQSYGLAALNALAAPALCLVGVLAGDWVSRGL